jgi:DNA-binding NarL/FixJ family response regulator
MDDSGKDNRVNTQSMAAVRLIIVDDHAVVRQGTRNLLTDVSKIEVLGECANGDELVEFLKKDVPQLILLDINLPGKNGLQLLAELKPKFPTLKIVLFSAHLELPYIAKAKELQADGYLSKTMSGEELQSAILRVVENPPSWVISADVAQVLEKASTEAPKANLTAREMEILSHLGQGLTNQSIAKTLCLSVKTVDTHVANLIKKTGARNRTQLLAYAYEHQLL